MVEKNIEKLIQELNHILNQVVRENSELKDIVRNIHAQGYSVQISFNAASGEPGAVARTHSDADDDDISRVHLELSKDDYLF